MLVLAVAGWIAPGLRLWGCALAYLVMPIAGIASPLAVDHLGDRTWEMYRYTKGAYQWRAGEFLGTRPFYELGRRFASVHDLAGEAGGRHLATALAMTGVLGALGFALLAVQLASVQAGAASGPWLGRARAAVATQLGYARILAFARRSAPFCRAERPRDLATLVLNRRNVYQRCRVTSP
jgi:hypothetical protein